MFHRLTSAVLGISVALAGFGILAYTMPSAGDPHWSNLAGASGHASAAAVDLILMVAFLIIGFGAFFMSYRLLKFAATGRKQS